MAKIKKMQAGGVAKPKAKVVAKKSGPTYKNLPMGVALEEEERTGYRKPGTKPTKQDSAAYKQGYDKGLRGEKGYSGESPIGRMGRWEGQNAKPKPVVKKKLQAGGVMKPTKRVGPIDPKGAYTKVQERTIAGKKAPKVPLKKDKELGATKMKNGGKLGSGERFAALKSKIQSKGKSSKAAGAIAASIGRKKYGAKKMAAMSAAGRKKA